MSQCRSSKVLLYSCLLGMCACTPETSPQQTGYCGWRGFSLDDSDVRADVSGTGNKEKERKRGRGRAPST